MDRNNVVLLSLTGAALLGAIAIGFALRSDPLPADGTPVPIRPLPEGAGADQPPPEPAERRPPEKWGEPEKWLTLGSGLEIGDLVRPSGIKQPQVGDYVLVEYTGWLEDGTMFDSSYNRDEPFRFPVGMGAVIPGWDVGLKTMTPGSERVLRIPSDLAYGPRGRPPVIPPNATLTFQIKLLEILPPRNAPTAPAAVPDDAWVTTASGLKYADLVVGDGHEVGPNSVLEVDYSGWMADGSKFDSSLDRGAPTQIKLGAGLVMPGWEEGLQGMKAGGKRQLRIPYALAYGEKGRPPLVPPKTDLIFDVEIVRAKH